MKRRVLLCLCVMLSMLLLAACSGEESPVAQTDATTAPAAAVSTTVPSLTTASAAATTTAAIVDDAQTTVSSATATTMTTIDDVTTTAPAVTTTTVSTAPVQPAVVTVTLAEEAVLADPAAYIEHTISDSIYRYPVLLKTDRTITDVYVKSQTFDTEGRHVDDETFALASTLTSGETHVVWLDFPGDMSAWALTYVDANGESVRLMLYISGMDGSLVTTTQDF